MEKELPTIPYLQEDAARHSEHPRRPAVSVPVVPIVALLFTVNLILLDIIVFFRFPGTGTSPVVSVVAQPQKASPICVDSCPNPTAAPVTRSVSPSPIPTPTASKTNTPTPAFTGPKEFFVPLGSGSNATDDWADVPGVTASINPTSYIGIASVIFEASLRIPTGNERAWVRLYNTTAKHPVWFSELSLEGGEPKLLTSPPVSLDQGQNTYQVQMKTSLKYPAYLDQARIRITIR